MQTALITGTTGFVGSHLADALRGTYRVIELNRHPGESSGDVRESIAWNFCDELPSELPGSVDLVVHAAATDARGSETSSASAFEINTRATERLLRYARGANVRAFVYLGTGSVYGLSDTPCDESQAIAPTGDYAATKAAAECLVLGCRRDFRVLSLRLFYPYGPGQRDERLIPRIAGRIRHGETVSLSGPEGLPRINPVYIEDLVSWFRLLVEGKAEGVFNIAGAETVTIRELAERIGETLGTAANFETGEPVDGSLVGSTAKITQVTGYVPEWTLARGLVGAFEASSMIESIQQGPHGPRSPVFE